MKLGLPHASSFLPLMTLKPLGLEPGRALANANPTPEQKQRQRAEQFRYIVIHCAELQRVAPTAPSLEARQRRLH